MERGRLLPLVAGACVLLLAGCGEGDAETAPQADLPSVGGGGNLTYALESVPVSLDPLAAVDREAQLVTRQIHEPLVASATPPYAEISRPGGLASSLRSSAGQTVWTATLREGVQFQDGTPFNAAAVLANTRRWASVPEGRALLPSLFVVDAPRPGEVRFQFERPVRDLRNRLGSPQLAIVSPQALRPSTGERARFLEGATQTGTGAYELVARSGAQIELFRDPLWWGSANGLGPALDSVVFPAVPDPARRLELLRAGEAQVIEPLDRAAAAAIAGDPLLVEESVGGVSVGMEASVRGLVGTSPIPVLSRVWLTRIPG